MAFEKRLHYFVSSLSVMLIVTVFAQDPVVQIKQTIPPTGNYQTIQAIRDQDVVMDCYVENKPLDVQVRWTKNWYEKSTGIYRTVPVSVDLGVEDNTKFGLEQPTYQTWRLRIRYIQLADEANYTCEVPTAGWGKIKSWDNRTVIVLIPPRLDLAYTSSDKTLEEGTDDEFVCNATGRPEPLVQWSRMGNALLPTGSETFSGSILPLKKIRPEFRGRYRCRVFNMVGDITRVMELRIQFKPRVTVAREVVAQKPGYLIELQCYIEANPVPKEAGLVWVKNNIVIMDTKRTQLIKTSGAFQRLSYELIIKSVKADDFGRYECRVKNDFGLTSAFVTLQQSQDPMPSIKRGVIISSANNYCGSWATVTVIVLMVSYLLH